MHISHATGPSCRSRIPLATMTALPSRLILLSAALSSLASAADSLQLTLPPAWYAVPGVPMSVYYDNIVLTEHPENLQFEVKCDVGTSEARRWTLTAAEKDAGDHPMQIT